jgi:hypothetical protein
VTRVFSSQIVLSPAVHYSRLSRAAPQLAYLAAQFFSNESDLFHEIGTQTPSKVASYYYNNPFRGTRIEIIIEILKRKSRSATLAVFYNFKFHLNQ